MAILVPTKCQNYWPKDNEFNNCSELLYYHRYCAFSLSRTTVEKKKNWRLNTFSLYGPLSSPILWRWGHECHNFSRGFHHNQQSSYSLCIFVFVNLNFFFILWLTNGTTEMTRSQFRLLLSKRYVSQNMVTIFLTVFK